MEMRSPMLRSTPSVAPLESQALKLLDSFKSDGRRSSLAKQRVLAALLLYPVGKLHVAFASLRDRNMPMLLNKFSNLGYSFIPDRVMRVPSEANRVKTRSAFVIHGGWFTTFHEFVLVSLALHPPRQAGTF